MTDRSLVRAAAVGVAAGLAGAYAMELWQTGATALKSTAAEAAGEDAQGGEPATEKAADRVSKAVRGRAVSKDGKTPAGRRVHYVTGAMLGGAYGVAVELWPSAQAGFGGALGLASTLVLDEALVPALGLSEPPAKTVPIDHAYGFMAHLVFGVATEAARRLLGGR